ncbi:MAG: DUF1254 domain-containing protein [Deltaproteobacteria bacterium]|nr:DUF1254 domain-containing protein [Deltaproteobacteria bacterium]
MVVLNNKTLYSMAWFDLRSGDLQFDVPPRDQFGRFGSVMPLDAFGKACMR